MAHSVRYRCIKPFNGCCGIYILYLLPYASRTHKQSEAVRRVFTLNATRPAFLTGVHCLYFIKSCAKTVPSIFPKAWLQGFKSINIVLSCVISHKGCFKAHWKLYYSGEVKLESCFIVWMETRIHENHVPPQFWCQIWNIQDFVWKLWTFNSNTLSLVFRNDKVMKRTNPAPHVVYTHTNKLYYQVKLCKCKK